jgi:magnesium transporter
VRGLAVGEIRLRDFWRVLWREAGSGLVLGILLGGVGFARALLWGSTTPLAITVGVSIRHLRLGQRRRGHDPDAPTAFKIDPTIMSAPVIATLVDATGLFIYFMIARSILGLYGEPTP